MADEDSVDTTYSTEDIRWLEDSLANTKPSTEDIRWLEDSLANTKPSTEDIRWLEDCLAGTKISTEEIRLPLEGSLLDSVFMPESSSSQPSKDRDSVHKKLCAGSQETNLPRKLIIQKRRDLVLFGEANHTHAIAIAAMRGGSWEGIVVTYLHRGLHELIHDELFPKREKYEKKKSHVNPSQLEDKEEFFAWAVLKAIEYTDRNLQDLTGKPLRGSFQECLEEVRKLHQVKYAVSMVKRPPEGNWKPGVDATKIKDLNVEDKVVWFQCPWVVAKEETKTNTTSKLVEGFLDHMAEKKAKYVLIGITTSTYNNYMSRYELENILKVEGEQLKSCKLEYDFVGADQSLIHDLLRHGYKHEGFSEIHSKILDKHLTLVFKRKSQ
jgi:hypothetical protein